MMDVLLLIFLFLISSIVLYFLIKIGVRDGINDSMLFSDEDRDNLEKKIIDNNSNR